MLIKKLVHRTSKCEVYMIKITFTSILYLKMSENKIGSHRTNESILMNTKQADMSE